MSKDYATKYTTIIPAHRGTYLLHVDTDEAGKHKINQGSPVIGWGYSPIDGSFDPITACPPSDYWAILFPNDCVYRPGIDQFEGGIDEAEHFLNHT